MIDQTRLPREERYVTCTDYRPGGRGDPDNGRFAARRPSASRRPWESRWGCSMRTLGRRVRRNLRNAGGHAAHGGKSFLGDRRDAAGLLGTARPAARGDPRKAARRGAADPAGRHRHQRMHRPQRRAADSGRQDRADALQCRRAGDSRLRNGAGRDPRGRGSPARRSTCSPTRRGRSCKARA